MAGCELQKTPVPTGGSRSDALVEMSCDIGGPEMPVAGCDTALASAMKRCNAWGYSRADPFEGTRIQCQSHDMYGSCTHGTVTRTYQCTS